MKISALMLAAAFFVIPSFAQEKATKGEATFQEICAGCHGNDGRAQTETGKKVHAADLTSSSVQERSDSDLAKSVKNGKGKMPAMAGKLSDDEIRDVLKYVRSFGGK